MKKFTTLLLTVALLGCDGVTPMTNDQIIEAYKKCKEAGMSVQRYYSGFSTEITNLQCTPTKQ